MIFLKRVILFFCVLIPAQLFAADFSEGQDYTRLPDQFRSNKLISQLIARDPNKVQVLFFFSYGCPACARFDPFFEKWAAADQDHKMVIYRFPVSFETNWADLARLYFVTQNILPKRNLNAEIFAAIHEQHLHLWEEPVMQEFMVKQGYKAQAVQTAYNSFTVKLQAKDADDISKAYDINQTPTIVINGPQGSFLLTVGQAGDDLNKLIQIMSYVISTQEHKTAKLDTNYSVIGDVKMASMNVDAPKIKDGLKALDDFQAKVDDATWLIKEPHMAKIRHISLHITRLSGSLADMCHKWEHAVHEDQAAAKSMAHIDQEKMQHLIADFVIHAAQLNRLMGTDLFELYAQQIARNVERFAPGSDLALQPPS